MITTKKAASGQLAAGELRRGAGALPLTTYFTLSPRKLQMQPPKHLTPTERELWLRAEELRSDGNRQDFWNTRRELLLEQSRRYQPAR